ncbi:DgyrCDS11001 [Dimorphilus gyrociliatus]|uniref:DgyrCDS11001 n=1 Tax=Dimorphilus gyrociliatus TaxID=2664684 RepID=A0A7I8W4J0_9ANNE|nr:DgyrCDS11001 [Dimorphilus gyrociliatus]
MKCPKLGKALLGAQTFCGINYSNDECGANGLPLTPTSIKILGRFKHQLLKLRHPNLCKYISLHRSKHERVVVVAEYYEKNLLEIINNQSEYFRDFELLSCLANEIVGSLVYLDKHDIVNRNLSPSVILFDENNRVKLFEYGLFYVTGWGQDVKFPIGQLKYMSPEVIAAGPKAKFGICNFSSKVDVWSVGLILLEAYIGTILWKELTTAKTIKKILSYLKFDGSAFDIIIKEDLNENQQKQIKLLPSEIYTLIRQCLLISAADRPKIQALYNFRLFKNFSKDVEKFDVRDDMFASTSRMKNFDFKCNAGNECMSDFLLEERTLDEIYYLWCIAGGDAINSFKKAFLVRPEPPVTTLPKFISLEGESAGQMRDKSNLYDGSVLILSQDQLRKRLSNLTEEDFFPLLNSELEKTGVSTNRSRNSNEFNQSESLPRIIREADVEYQFRRIILFDRLLLAYPSKQRDLQKEARIDIPPFLRAKIWSALLNVKGDIQGHFDSIDKETTIAIDRQIEVDIPRCHQYHELLSSPSGHQKLRRVLKAWVVNHPEYVYWQGLDSLAAPFVALNFDDEALAFCCLENFIPKYLHNFFLKDNSEVIQEYLAVFSHLISFHFPELSNHLNEIGFVPDLYAIPWFLTMFAHVLPLTSLWHIWDTLLLGNSSFPLCLGVAILEQLSPRLLQCEFNECILLFSDLPELDIERVVNNAIKIFRSTPKTATYRRHAHVKTDEKMKDTYYSEEYSLKKECLIANDPISLSELKREKLPRICSQDLLELLEFRKSSPSSSPTKVNGSDTSKPKMLIMDIRNPEE